MFARDAISRRRAAKLLFARLPLFLRPFVRFFHVLIARRGFLARVRLEPFGAGKIFPHEETLAVIPLDALKQHALDLQ